MKSLVLMFLPLAAAAQITSSPMVTGGGGGSSSINDITGLQNALDAKASNTDLVSVAFSGDYNDLGSLPDLTIYTQSNDLQTVAFTGDYNNLSNLPDLTVYEPAIATGLTAQYWRGDKTWSAIEQLTFSGNTFGVIDSGIWGPSANDKVSSQDGNTYFDNTGFHGNASGLTGLPSQVTAGSFSGVGTATTTFTVTIGVTEADTSYKVNVTPTAALSAAFFYVDGKTTTTFNVHYLTGLTGTVTFDWAVFP